MNILRVHVQNVLWLSVYINTIQVIESVCGELTYAAPAIAGRYVRLFFKPTPWRDDVRWDVRLDPVINQSAYNKTKDIENKTHIFDLMTFSKSKLIIAYELNSACRVDPLKVTLQDIDAKPCGLLQLNSQPIKPRGEVVLRFFPRRLFKLNPIPSIETKWRVHYDSCPKEDGCEVLVGGDAFRMETRTFYEDMEHRLIIQSMDSTKDGRYFLLCDEEKKIYTEDIEVKTPVMPSQPTFHNLQNKKFCGQCLVGKINEPYTIECEVHNGTAPEIKINVNGNETSYKASADGIYSRQVARLTEDHHNVPVQCQVTNYAYTKPLLTETKLYVARSPSKPVLHLGEMKEGSPVNVTCWSEGGRPAVRLVLNVSGQKESVGNARPDANAALSVVRLNKASMSWNGKKMKCCANKIIYDEICSEEHTISYKFPPTAVSVTTPRKFEIIMETYLLNITCSIEMFNGNCEPKWTLDGNSVSMAAISNVTVGTHVRNYSQSISVPVQKDDHGKTLVCSADCQEFPDLQKKASHQLVVPYEPKVTFASGLDVLILAEGETRDVQCIVDSQPKANVSWIRDGDKTNLNVQPCGQNGQNAVCMKLESVTRNITGYYTCNAQNALSRVVPRRLRIIVNGSEARRSADQTDPGDAGGFPVIVLVIALAAVIVVVLVAIVVVIIKKRSTERKVSVNYTVTPTDDQRNEDRASAANNPDPDHDTYATPMPKSQRPTPQPASTAQKTQSGGAPKETDHDTYATPMPKSQRPTPQPASTAQKTQADGAPKELIYADLALASEPASGAAAPGRPVVRRTESETEYVDIDFTKKAAPLPDPGGEESAADNVYANQ